MWTMYKLEVVTDAGMLLVMHGSLSSPAAMSQSVPWLRTPGRCRLIALGAQGAEVESGKKNPMSCWHAAWKARSPHSCASIAEKELGSLAWEAAIAAMHDQPACCLILLQLDTQHSQGLNHVLHILAVLHISHASITSWYMQSEWLP